jgi:hypothetical protein
MTTQRLLWMMLFLMAGWPSPSAAENVQPGTGWHEAFATLLDVDFGESGYHARWQFHHCACGDLLIRFEQSAPGDVDTGELLVLEKRLVLARGNLPASAEPASELQAPALMVQLAFGLLQRAIPGGPAAVEAELKIDLLERNADMTVETGMADAHFQAPWQIIGRAWPSGDGMRRFDFAFSFKNPLPDAPAPRSSIEFTGGQDFVRDDFPLGDAAPLTGWKMQWLDRENAPVEVPQEGMTLGEMRAWVREVQSASKVQ